ncbi:MAG: hypothetical protein EA351_01120 [Gemmatimonadales bacterium]|nr:MAG: hypothetical protein EA351_01120 [Gemmatimonadales bacterium]
MIGTLYDFEPISFSSNNTMDAAIASVAGADVSGSTPATAGYGAPSTSVTNATVGLEVQKYGRTTGHTTGTVAEINATVSICFQTRGPFMCAQSATFVNQFTITPGNFSSGGDSGSLIVDTAGNNPVGLLFAGSSTHTIANPIGPVLSRFGVTIDPGDEGDENGNGGNGGNGNGGDDDEVFDIDLTVNGYKVRGVKNADLTWNGSDAGEIDIFRNGVYVRTVSNTGSHTDNIGSRGGGSYTYQVCEAGTDTCSAQVTISF